MFFAADLPVWIGWENQIIENTQAFVLLLGAFQAIWFQRESDNDWQWLWCVAAPIWLICFARELSWGAVLYPPTSIGEHGPQFSSSTLWYKPFVYPTVSVVLLFVVVSIVKARALVRSLIPSKYMPWTELIFVAVCALVSTAAEGHMGLHTSFFAGDPQILEESAELCAYILLLAAQCRVRNFQNIS
ncbi:hypothetical protein [Phyllobacterium sp. SB3]|uniref:hypothetical protein n=1 Tax=Phyllobacterium sp. SB3 TaxID=3156073 RepID=UPI0032AF1190